MTTVVVPLSTATAASDAPTVQTVVRYTSGMFYGSVHYGTAVYGSLPTGVAATAHVPTIKLPITISTGSGSFYGSAIYGVAHYVGAAAILAVVPPPTVRAIVSYPVVLVYGINSYGDSVYGPSFTNIAVTSELFPVAVHVKVVLMQSDTMTAGFYFDVFGLITLMWVDNQGSRDIFVEFEHEDGRTWNGEFEPGGESTIDVSSGEMYVYFDIENESAYLNLMSVTMRDPA